MAGPGEGRGGENGGFRGLGHLCTQRRQRRTPCARRGGAHFSRSRRQAPGTDRSGVPRPADRSGAQGQGRASSTRFNGVSVARRKRVKDRKRVVWGKRLDVRGDLGGRRNINKTKYT